MIKVRMQPEIETDPLGGWQLDFWVFDGFDYTTPFREMLAEIAQALGKDPQSDLQLPEYEANEDFVEGILQFNSTPLGVYYEHALGYLSLTSDNEAILQEVANRIRPRVQIV
ncbi:hypothetical protein [Sphingopyxis fribergensis]